MCDIRSKEEPIYSVEDLKTDEEDPYNYWLGGTHFFLKEKLDLLKISPEPSEYYDDDGIYEDAYFDMDSLENIIYEAPTGYSDLNPGKDYDGYLRPPNRKTDEYVPMEAPTLPPLRKIQRAPVPPVAPVVPVPPVAPVAPVPPVAHVPPVTTVPPVTPLPPVTPVPTGDDDYESVQFSDIVEPQTNENENDRSPPLPPVRTRNKPVSTDANMEKNHAGTFSSHSSSLNSAQYYYSKYTHVRLSVHLSVCMSVSL